MPHFAWRRRARPWLGLTPFALVLLLESCLRPDRPLPEASGGAPGNGGNASTSGGNSSGGTPSGGSAGSRQEDDMNAQGAAPSGGSTTGGPPEPPHLSGTDRYDCAPKEGDEPTLGLEAFLTDLELPVFVTHAPNDSTLFVVELGGEILKINSDRERQTFLDLGDKVHVGDQGGDERGLLGLAFHPQYQENGLFYVHYSAGPAYEGELELGDSVIEEYHVTTDGGVDLDSGRLVLSVPQPDQNHKGGSLAFGLDGFLYIGLGDGGGSEDQYGNGQNDQTLLASILRIDPLPSEDGAYTIPDGNLSDVRPGARGEIWDMGLRNPFRFNFDACTGDLYVGDVGQDQKEELNIELPLSGQKNYGWSAMEGSDCFHDDCEPNGLTLPALEYDHEGAGASIIGGAVYRGHSLPSLRGAYFYADYVLNRVWSTRFDRATGTVENPVSRTQDLNVTAVVAIQNDSDGELLFVSLEQGTIYKLIASD
jgi:glucose/arabinose dehydrogenase